jgi:nucleoside transporter
MGGNRNRLTADKQALHSSAVAVCFMNCIGAGAMAMAQTPLTASSPASDGPNLLYLRLSAMMFLEYAVAGLWVPLASRYLLAPAESGGMGFSQLQVGLIYGLPATIGAFLAPFLAGQIADRHLATEKVLAVLLLAGGIVQWAISYQTAFAAWLGLAVLYSILYVPTMALSNGLAFAHLIEPRRQFPRVRVWGTIGWIVVAWTLPMVWLQHDLKWQWMPPFLVGSEVPAVTSRLVDCFKASGLVSAAYGLFCLLLPRTPPQRDAADRLAFRKAFRLFGNRSFAVLTAVGILIACTHQIYFIQTPPLLSHLGLRDADIMPAMSIGQFAEIAMMVVVGWLLKNLGFRAVLTIGTLAYATRFAIFGSTCLPLPLIVCSQSLHGVCFACFYAAAFIYVDRLAETDIRQSAQTLLGIILGAGPLIGGWLNGVLAGAFTPPGGELDYTRFWYTVSAIALAAAVTMGLFFCDETSKT